LVIKSKLDRSVERLGNKVEEIAASVPKTAKLLEMRLHARFDTKVKEVSTPLMAVLAANKFIDNTGDINYKDCRKIKTFAFAESYKEYMQVLVDGCEEINRAMDLGQEPAKKLYEKWSFTLKRAIQSVLAGGLVHIMKQDVVAPQINIWGGGAIKDGWSWVIDKLLESLPFLKPKPKKEEPASEKAAGNEKEEKPEEPQKPKKKPERKRPKEEEAQETRTGGGKPKPKGNKPKDKPAAANDNTANDNTYGPQPCRDATCNAGGYGPPPPPKNPEPKPKTVDEVLQKANQDPNLSAADREKLNSFTQDLQKDEPSFWEKLWSGFEESRIRKMGDKYRKYADKYERFARDNPVLAEYGLSAIVILAKTIATGGVAFIPSLGQEAAGRAIGEVLKEKFGEDINAGIAWQKEQFKLDLMKKHPGLSPLEAENYAELKVAAIIGGVGGASILRDVLKHIKLTKMAKAADIPDFPKKPEVKFEFDDTARKGGDKILKESLLTEIEWDKQGKHIRGHRNFIEGRSELTYSDPKSLVDKFSGRGAPANDIPRGHPGYKERFDAGEIIGQYVDLKGNKMPTTKGMIIYSKNGVHIYPIAP